MHGIGYHLETVLDIFYGERGPEKTILHYSRLSYVLSGSLRRVSLSPIVRIFWKATVL